MDVTDGYLKRIITEYLVNGYTNGLKATTIERYLRQAKDQPWFSKIKTPKRETVGIISDTHIPFEHPNYLQFCVDTFRMYGVTRVVHIGDLVDNHAISRHLSETSAMSAESEYAVALKRVGLWVKAFPDMTLCTGNHDLIPHRQAATLGMPEPFLKTLRELWMLPKEWRIVPEVIIDGVYYFHGIGSTGKTPAYNRMTNNRMSTVQGHTHSRFGIAYHANPTDICFGMDVGCGIDDEQYAFTYGKPFANKPILGCGIVFSKSAGMVVPMSEGYLRSGKS